jgi:hypothetical protein
VKFGVGRPILTNLRVLQIAAVCSNRNHDVGLIRPRLAEQGLNMAEWLIRWGIPLTLLGGYVAAVAASGGSPTTIFYDLLESIRSGVMGVVPRIL